MALFLPAAELQLARGESYRDTALVLSRFLSALMIRTFEQEEVETFAEHASIPVINGLTDETHPLQALADAMTLRERFGSLEGSGSRTSATATTCATRSCASPARFGMEFVAATPRGTSRRRVRRSRRGGRAGERRQRRDRHGSTRGARGAQPLYTDVWTSMGQEADRERRLRDLEPYRIDDALLALADHEAVAMHCLPAHVGEEITPTCSTGRAASRGSRPRTGCTRRKR